MHNLMADKKFKRFIATHWWIYVAFVTAIILTLFVIAKITSPHPTTALSDSKKATFEIVKQVFIVVSLVLVAVNLWLRRNFLFDKGKYTKCANIQEVFMRYGRYCLWSLGISEIVALFGYIMCFLTMQMSQGLILIVISGVSFAFSTPSAKNLRRIVESRLAEYSGNAEIFVGERELENVVTGVASRQDIKIPSLFARTIAYLLDFVLMSLLAFFVVKFISGYKTARIDDVLYGWLTAFFLIVYHAFSIYFFGRTVGCLVLRLRIVSKDESELTLKRSFARGALLIIVLLCEAGIPIGLIFHVVEMAIAIYRKDKYKRTSWDMAAKTVVIKA